MVFNLKSIYRLIWRIQTAEKMNFEDVIFSKLRFLQDFFHLLAFNCSKRHNVTQIDITS